MISPLEVPVKKDGTPNLEVSEYSDVATPEETLRLGQIRDDFNTGYTLMNRGYTQFNERSVVSYMNDNQQAFNSYVPPRSQDPDDSWRAQTVRPITRNKLISIAAHITAQTIIPTTFAQNENDEEDKEASRVMNDLIDWTIKNSAYERKFISAVIGALVNPATIMNADYVEVMKTVREKQANGEITKKQMVDQVLSGFQASVIPPDELFIANMYEVNVQRQRFLVRRQFISYDDAAVLYGTRKNFKYVKPGIRTIFIDKMGMFYEQRDEDLDESQVELLTYHNRGADLKIAVCNGVMMDDPDEPNPRIDKLYPFAKSFYEPFDEGEFFYGKSAADKLGPDQELVDTLYNMVMDGTFLQLMPPMAVFGNEELDSNVFVPGATFNFREEGSKLESIAPPSDLRAGLASIQEVEKSMTESSVSPQQSGQGQAGEQTAYEIERLETNARISLGLFGKMIGFLVEDFGNLMVGDIVQHYTVGDVMELTSGQTRMKFMSYLIPDVNEGGRNVSRKIQFTDQLKPMTKDEKLGKSLQLFDNEGGFDAKKKLILVNPTIFRKLKYKITVDTETMIPRSRNIEKALKLEAYDRMIQNPLIDQEAITKEFLIDAFKPGESDRYMSKRPQGEQMMEGGQKNVNDNLVGQMTGSNSLGATQGLDELSQL